MGSHALEDQHKIYADAEGCSTRTAQRHSRSNHPRWVEFWRDRGISSAQRDKDASLAPAPGVKAPGVPAPPSAPGMPLPSFDPPTPPDAMRKAHADRTHEESVLCTQFMIYAKLAQDFTDTTDPILRASLARAIPEAMKAFRDAAKACQSAQTAARVLVPIAEFNECAADLSHVSAILNTMDLEIADKANPADPATARSAIKRWLTERFNPMLDAIIAGFTAHGPAESSPPIIEATLVPA